MLETPEQIQSTLNLAGEVINFLEILDETVDPAVTVRESFSIKAIPGMTVYNVQDYSSPADLQTKDTIFRCSSLDYIANAVAPMDLFTYSPSNTPNRVFTFQIINSYDDYTGWIAMQVQLTDVTDVV